MDKQQKWNDLLLRKGWMVDFLGAKETNDKIMKYYGVSTEKEMLNELGSDFYYLPVRDISQNENFLKCYKKKLEVKETQRVCPFGIRWQRGAYESKFSVDEAIDSPLKNAETVSDILNYTFPKSEDFDFSSLIEDADNNNDRIKIGGLWTGIMGDCYRMIGFEKFLTYLAMEPEIIHTLIDKMTDMYISLNDKYFQTLKGKFEVYFLGNDFGSQNSMLMSTDMWYEFFYENYKKICSHAKSYNLTIMKHSCGAIKPIIPYLIEAGVEILDPVQTTAKGMNPEQLSQEFGNKIIFHGGVDTQHTLPLGTTEDVQKETEYLVKTFTKQGSYILAGAQVINKDVPAKNIIAMYDCAKKLKSKGI